MEKLIDAVCHNCGSEVLIPEFGDKTCMVCGKEIVSCGDCSDGCVAGARRDGRSGQSNA